MERRSSRFPTVVGVLCVTFLTVLAVRAVARDSVVLLVALLVFAVPAVAAGTVSRVTWARFFAQHFGWLPPAFGALSYPFWYWNAYPHEVPEQEYFAVVAGVLPVLVLATTIDVRRSDLLESRQLVLPLIAIIASEMVALFAVAYRRLVDRQSFAAVASGVVVAFISLTLAILANVADKPSTAP